MKILGIDRITSKEFQKNRKVVFIWLIFNADILLYFYTFLVNLYKDFAKIKEKFNILMLLCTKQTKTVERIIEI